MITRTIKKWIDSIHRPETWLQPDAKQLSDHSKILDRDKIVNRIMQEIRSGGLILLFADFDCDGTTAGTILFEALRYFGARVQCMFASRFSGGYGLSDIACDRILSKHPSLVVTLDCGSSDGDRIQRLKNASVDTCTIDHHLVPDKPLPAVGFLNPHRPECDSTDKDMASCGLAWSVVWGLKKQLGSDIDLSQFLDLVAIGTIGDVAPLIGDNRILVRKGLSLLEKPARPGLAALYEATKFKPSSVLTGRDLGFRICPGLNAPGRLGDPDIILDLLMEKDPERARAIAQQVVDLWQKRRLDTETITEEAIRHVDETNQHLSNAIVVGHEEWNHGIVGIVAARLVEKYQVPVCVLGHEGRGSLRGPLGSTLYDALCYCKDTLVKYGGHQAAAGCQVEWERLKDFRCKFSEFFARNPITKPDVESGNILEFDPSDDILSVANDINRLEPCGQGNPRPIVSVTCQVKAAKAVKGNHLKIDLILPNGQNLSGFYLNQGDLASSLTFGKYISLTGDLKRSSWNNRIRAELFVNNIALPE